MQPHSIIQSPNVMSSLTFTQTFEFLPFPSTVNSVITPSFDNFYLPPILTKHHTWYLSDADLFISIHRILYEIHQQVENSLLFQEILRFRQDHRIGVIPVHPIPFDDLKREIFNKFLVLLYYGTIPLNHLSRNDWVDVKRLCIDWYLPHQTAMIIQRLCEIRLLLYSPQYWYFLNSSFQNINHRQNQIWRYHQGVINKSFPEDIVIIEDD
jgi:hypothetical protein